MIANILLFIVNIFVQRKRLIEMAENYIYTIVKKESLANSIYLMDVKAPRVAKNWRRLAGDVCVPLIGAYFRPRQRGMVTAVWWAEFGLLRLCACSCRRQCSEQD